MLYQLFQTGSIVTVSCMLGLPVSLPHYIVYPSGEMEASVPINTVSFFNECMHISELSYN